MCGRPDRAGAPQIDTIQGVTPKVSVDIQRDFKIPDSVGALAGSLCASESYISRCASDTSRVSILRHS
jgi:hypothetical protein